MGLLQKIGLVAGNESGNGALTYEKMQWTIAKVDIAYEHKALKLEKRADGRPYFIIKLKERGGDEIVLKQLLFLNKDGSARSPISKSWVNKEGALQPASLMYDIKVAIEAEMTPEQIEKWLAVSWDDEERWVGKTFIMDTKKGTTKDGRTFYILGTSEQKYYDNLSVEMKAATGEWVSDKAVLREWAQSGVTISKALKDVTTPVGNAEAKDKKNDDDLPF